MITGIETAGLVLAAFPLLISALEHYREGFEPLADWWKFRTEFVAFIHVIDRQWLLFSENLEELLSPIITSEADMGALLQDPIGAAWRCPELEAKLRERLPKSYQSYRDTIDDMKGSMDVLQKKLGIKDGKITWVNDDTSPAKNRVKCEYELRRIKFVLSKKKREKLVGGLTANNDELQKLFASSERLATHRKRRVTPNIFKCIRNQACGLYSVLATGWRCDCPDMEPSHYANLLLEKRIDSSKRENHMEKFQQPKANLKILFQLRRESEEEPMRWHETEVRLLEAEGYQSIPLAPKTSQHATVTDFTHLAHTFETSASDNTLPWREPTKKVVFPQIVLQPSEPQVSAHDLIEIADLCAAVQNACHRRGHLPLGYLKDPENRRHAFYPSIQPTIFAHDAETVTLASLLSKSKNRADPSKMKLSRLDRYTIAVTLASSLLQLYSSPWIGETWGKEEIYFLKAVEGSSQPIIVDRPYISRKFTTYRPHTHSPSDGQSVHCRTSTRILQALGIMLLELCFGQAIEDQPIREKYIGRNGQPNDMTDFSTAQHWWENDALGEGGEEFYLAIRRCLFCAFGPKSTDLEDDELRAAIYSEVVEPLERAVRHFDPNG